MDALEAPRTMKLIMTLLVRDEADIVQANIEYHLAQGVDFVIVTDHGSEDGTSEILGEYERLGMARVIRDELPGHHQSNRVTRMVEMARTEHDADWVINNDADEFWWPVVGSLRDVFAAIPERFGQIEAQRYNFRPQRECDAPFYSRLVLREAISLSPRGYALGPKVAHRPDPNAVVAPGNHSLRGTEMPLMRATGLLEIFHFPMRTYEQFERKVLYTGLGYEQIPDRSPGVGDDQLALLALQRAGKLREYYDEQMLDGEIVERELQSGTVVLDRRLGDFMCALHSGERAPAGPELASRSALLAQTMDALDRIEQQREELQRLHGENASASALIEDLRAQLAGLTARLDGARDELRSTSEALHLLRSSRLMQATRPIRRMYYRARGD
jgi:hypothetical protein